MVVQKDNARGLYLDNISVNWNIELTKKLGILLRFIRDLHDDFYDVKKKYGSRKTIRNYVISV